MKFDDLDSKMRAYETLHDRCVLPNMFIVARIDGRSFTKLTKETHSFTVPFDERFRDLIIETVNHLMNCGFNVIYGYTESDEISLLFHISETSFSRKTRKLISILAGEASAKFSSLLGDVGAFDCRLSELPNKQLVVDYFRWRNEDAHRNALSAHCYWRLRQDNYSQRQATSKLDGLSTEEKVKLLFQYGINFDKLPLWQKRGIGIYWINSQKRGYNPKTNQEVYTDRRELYTNLELPMGENYSNFIIELIDKYDSSKIQTLDSTV
ncbi:MAG: guanylyltransferase [Candidatus Kapabacteria bacterium]|nr:guanylyltransferase [Candidatus Kapabacteria bacterium]MBX7154133.1 guanylyltransferase [Bacteroidota bacterium]